MITCLKHLFIIATTLLATSALPATWSVSPSSTNGLPTITRSGAPALKSIYIFFTANWGWADMPTSFTVTAPYTYTVTGRNNTLSFNLTNNIARSGDSQMVWDFDLNAATTTNNIIGGGISFVFDLATFGAEMGPPVILPGNAGWTWGKGSSRIEYRFDRTPAALFFEPGTKNEIRAYFYNGSVPAGQTRYRATLSLAGDTAFVQTLPERFGLSDPTGWPANIMDWRASPVDLSFLNKPEIPAGKHGFLRTARDQLVFQDGTSARFWGTNLSAYTLFATSRDGVRQQARRLSQLGFNLVRLHHHDSPWVNPNVFGPTTGPNTLTLSPAALEKLDWWIKCLKDEGIYVWLDLHVQRFVKAGDRIDWFAEIARGKADADPKGYNFVNPGIQRAMRDFARDYVNHVNSHTGLAYKNEPAIIAMLVTNENDLTTHYGTLLQPDKNVPQHSAVYMGEASKFATAWGLNKDATWQAWTYGPTKLFLNDLERRFHADQIGNLRSLGVKVPIATTSSWGGNPLSSLPSITTGSLIDTHSYGGIGELEKNPLYQPIFANWIGAAQVAGMPLTVSEWNLESFPAPDRHSAPLYLAGYASLHGWDALMQYAYSQGALDSISVPSNWHAYSDPAMLATLPAAALLYRQRHVRESETVYVFAPTPQQLFYEKISPINSIALRTAFERGRLLIAMPAVKELPWLTKSAIPGGAVTLITNPQQNLLGSLTGGISSDTGQLRRDWDQGIYTITTPRTQAVMGWIGGRSIQLPDVRVDVSTRNATVAVQTLDGRPVSTSRDIMISLGARSTPVNNRMPYYSEPVEGSLAIRGPAGLRLYKKLPDGSDQELAATYVNGSYNISLDAALKTYWLRLR